MNYFDVKIIFTDGTEELVQSASRVRSQDGVLHLSRDAPYSGATDHLGSYPLVNIRSWTKVQR